MKIVWIAVLARTVSAKRRSLDERSVLGVALALTRAFRKVGAEPESTLKASISDLNLMRAATGSQWSSMSGGVTCALFGWLNTRRAAAFWIICNGFTTQAGRPVRRALQ